MHPFAQVSGYRRGEPAFRKLNLALFAAGLATFAQLYDAQSVLPLISRGFGVSPAGAALSVSVATGALALALIPVSCLSERWGRARMMSAAVLAASVFGLLAPFAPSFGILLVLRAAQGVALAGLPAVAMAYLAEEVHSDSLGTAMGLYIAGNSIGGMGGRLVASAVADLGGWRWGLGAVGALCLLCAIVFRLVLPPSRRFQPSTASPREVAGVLRDHLADPRLRRLYATGMLLMAAFVTVYNYLGYRLLAAPFRLSPAVVGLLFLAYAAGTVSSGVAGRLTDSMGRRLVLAAATLLAVAGLALTTGDWLPLIAVGLVALTAGFFAAHSVASGWVGRIATTGRAQASALYLTAYYTGSSLGGWLGGIAYGRAHWAGTELFVAVLLLAALLLAVTFRQNAPRPRPVPACVPYRANQAAHSVHS